MAEARRCLRPNLPRAGRSVLCQRLLEWYEVACTHHATAAENEVAYQRLRADTHRDPGWVEVPLPLDGPGSAGWEAECVEFGCHSPLSDPPSLLTPPVSGAGGAAESSATLGPYTPMPSIFRSQSPGGDG